MSERKKTSISIAEKMRILSVVNENRHRKRVDIAKELGIAPSTLNSIVAKAKQIEESASVLGVSASKRKRIQGGKHEDVEDCLLQWFRQHRAEGIPISGPMLCEKATELAGRLGVENFSASSGWLHKFKGRHGISCHNVCGESKSVDPETVRDWKETRLKELTSKFAPKNIFNADETGLFYNVLPDRTMAFKGENCHGGKISKQRVTVLLCANSDGSEKLPPLTIGKFAKPRCFKNVVTYPTKYTSNKKSWITTKVFESWLRNIDAKMGAAARKILLLVDRCAAHPQLTPYLRNVTVEFFPANCTSELQPLDLGVIHNFKLHYRKMLVQHAIRCVNVGKKDEMKINILQVRFLRDIYCLLYYRNKTKLMRN